MIITNCLYQSGRTQKRLRKACQNDKAGICQERTDKMTQSRQPSMQASCFMQSRQTPITKISAPHLRNIRTGFETQRPVDEGCWKSVFKARRLSFQSPPPFFQSPPCLISKPAVFFSKPAGFFGRVRRVFLRQTNPLCFNAMHCALSKGYTNLISVLSAYTDALYCLDR
ncbi:hypothetical protein IX321_001500 [Bacteroides pyogenes]|nr:hypothetical protein [Bacteroides pyogenes]MBR8717263.1 hypothetical protein [Bacteroides pyogenes]MBR8746959.1 hypothetical protein [Bacteroides pyogenes]MBR8757342.1 hypothetical protein [Bacteroides pyogenes]MBR8780536.1 hypothetical protein [Bacteroides pyogenes]